MLAEAREKERRDIQAMIEDGRKEGRNEGRNEMALETAKRFLDMGLSPEQVAKGTDLDLEAIQELHR
jgi:predicted transposase/invertase (TIGR01784 family)